jgi:hypothetical protein
MPHKGYDLFLVTPGSANTLTCNVCGESLTPDRNRQGPTGFVEAMAGTSRPHDAFICPFTDAPWHRRALDLILAIEATPSPRVADLMKQDLADALADRPD